MKTIVMGAGIVGISTAWYLKKLGHDVMVVDRQDAAARETSFGNAGQISVCNCTPWADAGVPLKALKWMFDRDAPLLYRPRLPWGEGFYQYRWLLNFLAQCNTQSFDQNLAECVGLGVYSHAAYQELLAEMPFEFNRLQRGILNFYTDKKELDSAISVAKKMKKLGVERNIISTDEVVKIEPALAQIKEKIKGGTYTESDESGDCKRLTQGMAAQCEKLGVTFYWRHQVSALTVANGQLKGVQLRNLETLEDVFLQADSYVMAMANESAQFLRPYGIDLDIYPGKGFSATVPIKKPEQAPMASLLDDGNKVAISRFGHFLRIAGTIQVGNYDLTLTSKTAQARCQLLLRCIEQTFPGVCDVRTEEEGGSPNFWTGLRPATPKNLPYIGRSKLEGLWVNCGHGTLGYTHGAGSGKALAHLMQGESPQTLKMGAFKFYGY